MIKEQLFLHAISGNLKKFEEEFAKVSYAEALEGIINKALEFPSEEGLKEYYNNGYTILHTIIVANYTDVVDSILHRLIELQLIHTENQPNSRCKEYFVDVERFCKKAIKDFEGSDDYFLSLEISKEERENYKKSKKLSENLYTQLTYFLEDKVKSKFFKLLLSNKYGIKPRTVQSVKDGFSALHFAIIMSLYELTRVLVKHRFEISVDRNKGLPPSEFGDCDKFGFVRKYEDEYIEDSDSKIKQEAEELLSKLEEYLKDLKYNDPQSHENFIDEKYGEGNMTYKQKFSKSIEILKGVVKSEKVGRAEFLQFLQLISIATKFEKEFLDQQKKAIMYQQQGGQGGQCSASIGQPPRVFIGPPFSMHMISIGITPYSPPSLPPSLGWPLSWQQEPSNWNSDYEEVPKVETDIEIQNDVISIKDPLMQNALSRRRRSLISTQLRNTRVEQQIQRATTSASSVLSS